MDLAGLVRRRGGSFTLLGTYTQSFLKILHVDLALVGMRAVTGELLGDTNIPVAEARRTMIGAARRKVVLVDHSKLIPPVFFDIARIDAIHDLVTDDAIPEKTPGTARTSGKTRIHII